MRNYISLVKVGAVTVGGALGVYAQKKQGPSIGHGDSSRSRHLGLCNNNSICDTGENVLGCSDCGPFDLGTATYPSIYHSNVAFMFDVTVVNDILVSSITIKLANNGVSDVSVYTASGGFSDKFQNETLWTKIFGSASYSSPDREFKLRPMTLFEITMNFSSDIGVNAGIVQSFYIHATGGVVASIKSPSDPLVSDNNLEIAALAKGSLAPWGSLVFNDLSL
eukprot:scaffold30307_cov46-Cyclotella_meneghiniana.AAC.3